MFDANCLRRTANWTVLEKEHKFEKDTFNVKKFKEDLPKASPKLFELLEKIQELDKQDIVNEGKKFKHFIFSDVKQGGYGAKIVSSGLMAYGMNLCYNNKVHMKTEEELMRTRSNNFGFLCSTTIYDQTLSVGVKKTMLEMFNRRPDNVHGDLFRIMVADAGFKEGIDLFDIKYVHIFEPQTSEADQKQAIGRATRKCGQAGLKFHPTQGWTLNVFVYDVKLPERLVAKMGEAKTLFDMYLKNTSIDLRHINFGKEIEQLMIQGAIDYPLNQNILNYHVGQDGGDGDDGNVGNVGFIGGNVNVVVAKKKKPTPGPIKLDDVVRCDKPCSINRPSKYVPVALPLFATVAIVIGAPLPDKKLKKPRQHFCELLKESPEFCANVQSAFAHQEKYVTKNLSVLMKAIEQGKHMELRRTVRPLFLRYVYKFVPKPMQEVIASMPNVQKALVEEVKDADNVRINAEDAVNASNASNASNVSNVSNVSNASNTKGDRSPTTTEVNVSLNAKVDRSRTTIRSDKRSVVSNTAKRVEEFKYVLDGIPRVDKKMSFKEMRDYIVDNFGVFTWPKIKLENLCVSSGGDGNVQGDVEGDVKVDNDANVLLKEMKDAINANTAKELKSITNSVSSSKVKIATFSPSQDFIRHYLTPTNPYKGMLLWHSVGVGKTCTAIATATSTFEKEGWTILWVTRTTLKDDIWKNMFDTVCSLSMQERLAKGGKFPVKMADKMRLLPPSWSIRPMSYKQFTNLVSGTNKMYQDLVKKNGADDPLKKTLIIIDEAHKLYGGHDLLPAEKPDMKKFKSALNKSYSMSGTESVKLLLMSATPYSKDPLEMIKLLNLLKDGKEQLPTSFDEFEQVFLNARSGTFTSDGKGLFLDQISGLVSYLDRGSDAREFAQPVIQLVNVPLSERPVADLVALKKEHDKDVLAIKSIIRQLDESFVIFKKIKMQQIKNELKVTCGHLKGLDYLDCKNNPTPYMKMLLAAIDDMGEKINKIKVAHNNDIKKLNEEFNRIKEIYENSISQEHIIETKCNKDVKK
jgi:hypothetical protein